MGHDLDRLQPELAERPVAWRAGPRGWRPRGRARAPRPSSRSRRPPRPAGCPGPRCWRGPRRPRRPPSQLIASPGREVELYAGDPPLGVLARVGLRDARPARDLGVLADRDEHVDVGRPVAAQRDHAVGEGRVGAAQHALKSAACHHGAPCRGSSSGSPRSCSCGRRCSTGRSCGRCGGCAVPPPRRRRRARPPRGSR